MNDDVITKITEKDRIFGKLCLEAQNSYKQSNYFSALACLFVITEQIIKFSVNKIDGNFQKTILEAKRERIINEEEFKIVDHLRDIRNKIFHENHVASGLEIEGKFWAFGEEETRQLIYDNFSYKLFQLVFKLL